MSFIAHPRECDLDHCLITNFNEKLLLQSNISNKNKSSKNRTKNQMFVNLSFNFSYAQHIKLENAYLLLRN